MALATDNVMYTMWTMYGTVAPPRGTVREACTCASRWCHRHGLHLMGFPEDDPGPGWRYLMAVG